MPTPKLELIKTLALLIKCLTKKLELEQLQGRFSKTLELPFHPTTFTAI
jgi:hypothetical protein